MPISSQIPQTQTVKSLVRIWAARYAPKISNLSIGDNDLTRDKLRKAVSPHGRIQVVGKLDKQLVEEKCNLAAIRVKDTYASLNNFDFRDVLRLAQFSSSVYLKLLEIYQDSPTVATSPTKEFRVMFEDSSLVAWGIPKVEQLANALEPLLSDFREKYTIDKDWGIRGLVTTQFALSNALLLEQLNPVEQVLLHAYFAWLEEHVAIPWQRVCFTATKYDLTDPVFKLVELLFLKVPEISMASHERFCASFPMYISPRGKLTDLAVKHSCLRDFSMFQAYLLWSIVQGDLKPIEQELVSLCIIVMEKVGVPWTMTVKGTRLMIDEILKCLDPQQARLIKPYAKGMIQAFQSRSSL